MHQDREGKAVPDPPVRRTGTKSSNENHKKKLLKKKTRRSLKRRRKKVTEEDNMPRDVTGSNEPAASDDTSVTILEGGTGNIRSKRENVKRAEDDWLVDDTRGESEDCDSYADSENSLGDLMDILGMDNWDWKNDEMKWISEADMVSSFQEDPFLS